MIVVAAEADISIPSVWDRFGISSRILSWFIAIVFR